MFHEEGFAVCVGTHTAIFFSTKWAWVFLGEIATLEPCRESRREIATLALAMTGL